VLEEKIAELEGGAGACCVCTGMAATVTVMTACLKAGDHCVITDCSYGEYCAAVELTAACLQLQSSQSLQCATPS
jgi:O-acetylhomoserine/O-acetylserine sulfhydrylase-like pyridoxal-dependent enzyme